jgi:ankyrin repeat protein
VADITPPPNQQDAMGASSSLPQYDPLHNPQLLPNTSLDTYHNLPAPHNMFPNVMDTFSSPGTAIMASPPTTDNSPSPNSDDGHLPVLHIAAFRGRTFIISLLLDQSLPINEQDSTGRTPLHLAAMTGHADAANILLARGAFANAKDNLGRTPIHWAALGKYEKTLKVLISEGADVNAADNNDWTVVHVCAERGWAEGLTAVLQAGGDLTRKARKCEVWRRQEQSAD